MSQILGGFKGVVPLDCQMVIKSIFLPTMVLGMVPNVRNWTTGRHLVVGVARVCHFLLAPIRNVKAYDFAHFSKLG